MLNSHIWLVATVLGSTALGCTGSSAEKVVWVGEVQQEGTRADWRPGVGGKTEVVGLGPHTSKMRWDDQPGLPPASIGWTHSQASASYGCSVGLGFLSPRKWWWPSDPWVTPLTVAIPSNTTTREPGGA